MAKIYGVTAAQMTQMLDEAGLKGEKLAPKNKRSRSGRRKDIPDIKGGNPKGLFVRSAWEANIARICMWQKRTGMIYDWGFEDIEFEFPVKRGTRFYIPDFSIIDKEGDSPRYLEVKGYMDAKSKTKLKRMIKYYPDVVVEVVALPEMQRLKKRYSGIIPNWES